MSKKSAVNIIFMFILALGSVFATGQDEKGGKVSQYQVREGCEEPLEISIGWWGIDTNLVDDDLLRDKIEGEFNIKIIGKNFTWGDYNEKTRLWAVSGDLPDIFTSDIVNTPDYVQWIDQGIIRALPDDLSDYPNVRKVLDIDEMNSLKHPSGKIYIIPRTKQFEDDRTTLARGMYVRKDWMNKLGFQSPKSFEDFFNMTKAFTMNDPDGNGKNDTTGITIAHKAYLLTLFLPTAPQVITDSWVKKEGMWVPVWTTPEFNEGLAQFHKLYHEGALDPDIAFLKGSEGADKFSSGKAGILLGQTTPGATSSLKTNWEKYNDTPFDEAVEIMHVWPSKDGNQYRHTENSFWSSTYFRGDLEEAKMERILKLYDYLLSDEGIMLLTYGMEGEDFTQEGDEITFIQEKNADGDVITLATKYKSLGVFGGLASWYEFLDYENNEINRLRFSEEALNMSLASFNWKMENALAPPVNYAIDLMYTPAKIKIKFDHDLFLEVLLDPKDPIQSWEKIIKEYESQDLLKAIEEVNEKAKKMGY